LLKISLFFHRRYIICAVLHAVIQDRAKKPKRVFLPTERQRHIIKWIYTSKKVQIWKFVYVRSLSVSFFIEKEPHKQLRMKRKRKGER
jgi:hypothetical protein